MVSFAKKGPIDDKFVEMIKNLDEEKVKKEIDKLKIYNKVDVNGMSIYNEVDLKNFDDFAVSINLEKCIIIVWGYNKAQNAYNIPIKAIYCSPNKLNTPKGLHHPQAFIKDFHMMYGNSNYCLYCIRIHRKFLIHSPIFEKRNHYSLRTESYNGLGKAISSGCIRVSTGDAAWFFDHLSKKSPIYIYKSDYSGPIFPEELEKIDKKQNFDPTDPYIIEQYINALRELENATKSELDVENDEDINKNENKIIDEIDKNNINSEKDKENEQIKSVEEIERVLTETKIKVKVKPSTYVEPEPEKKFKKKK